MYQTPSWVYLKASHLRVATLPRYLRSDRFSAADVANETAPVSSFATRTYVFFFEFFFLPLFVSSFLHSSIANFLSYVASRSRALACC